MIPEAAVEAASRAEYEHQFLMLEGTWAEATREVQALFKQSAAVALEAAAPHMLQHFANRVDWRCIDCEEPIAPDEALKILRKESGD